jgi:hypothetical protein
LIGSVEFIPRRSRRAAGVGRCCRCAPGVGEEFPQPGGPIRGEGKEGRERSARGYLWSVSRRLKGARG